MRVGALLWLVRCQGVSICLMRQRLQGQTPGCLEVTREWLGSATHAPPAGWCLPMQRTSQRARAAMTGHEQRLRGRPSTSSAGMGSPEGTGMCPFGVGRACVHSHVVHAFRCVRRAFGLYQVCIR